MTRETMREAATDAIQKRWNELKACGPSDLADAAITALWPLFAEHAVNAVRSVPHGPGYGVACCEAAIRAEGAPK